MRSSLVFFTLLFTSAAQAQFIAPTVFAIELDFEIMSLTGTGTAIANVASSTEIVATRGTGATIEDTEFATYRADRSVTVVNGIAHVTLMGDESAKLFRLGVKRLEPFAGKQYLAMDFIWTGFHIVKEGSALYWDSTVAGIIKAGFQQEGEQLITDGGCVIVNRAFNAGTKITYGPDQKAGGYAIKLNSISVIPRLLGSS